MDPRHVLVAAGDRPADAELERRQHPRERAAAAVEDDAGAHAHDAHAELLGARGLVLPGDADLREEVGPGRARTRRRPRRPAARSSRRPRTRRGRPGRGSAARRPSTRLRVPVSRDSAIARRDASVQRWSTRSPARWTIASRPARAEAGAGPVVRVPRARPARRARPRSCSGSRDSTVTSSPRARSARTSFVPISPLAPVRVTRMPPPDSLIEGDTRRPAPALNPVDRDARVNRHVRQRERGRRAARRALPHRRKLARLSRVLRPPRVDRDLHRLSDERDLRVRLDAREAPHRLRQQADRRRLGRGLLGPQGGLARTTRRRAPRARACSRSSGRTSSRSSRPSATATSACRASRPTTSSPRSPSAPAARASRSWSSPATATRSRSSTRTRSVRVMATGRGITDTKVYDHQAVDRPLRDRARPDPRLLRAQGRHVGQHPGRSRASATRPRRSCCSSSARSRASSPTSTTSRAPSASRT